MPDFNNSASPNVKTERFKIYIDVGSSALTNTWELQGRGIASWAIEQNQDINKSTDVLGFVDMDRGTAQPVQSGVEVKLRKGNALSKMLYDAWETNDYSALDNISILQKYEFVDDETTGYCRAKLQNGCMIAINSFGGEAGGYLMFNIDIHYSNDFVRGSMLAQDGQTITFVPDDETEETNDTEE